MGLVFDMASRGLIPAKSVNPVRNSSGALTPGGIVLKCNPAIGGTEQRAFAAPTRCASAQRGESGSGHAGGGLFLTGKKERVDV